MARTATGTTRTATAAQRWTAGGTPPVYSPTGANAFPAAGPTAPQPKRYEVLLAAGYPLVNLYRVHPTSGKVQRDPAIEEPDGPPGRYLTRRQPETPCPQSAYTGFLTPEEALQETLTATRAQLARYERAMARRTAFLRKVEAVIAADVAG